VIIPLTLAMAELVGEATTAQATGQVNQANGVPIAPAVQGQGLTMPPTAPPEQGGRSLRKRAPTMDTTSSSPTHEGDRTTRSGASFANRPKWMPKLKLKVNESSDGRRQSFLGPYDRDLDSEDEDLVFEEQFLLRMPPGKELERLREVVAKRGAASDIWFKFKGI
jgi:transcription initiation factor TFIID subunit 7